VEPATVLAFIVPKLGIQAENAVSDCLYFILTAYPAAAKSFVDYLKPTGVNLPAKLEFAAQMTWDHPGSRPDLLGLSNGQPRLVVEAKFDAPLTKRQPVDYIEYLPKDGAGVLLFIAPAKRTADLWKTLARHCASARIPLDPPEESPEGLVSARLRHTHALALASWERLIATLLRTIPPDAQPNPRADFLQLSALCDRLLSGDLPASPALQSVAENDKRDRQLRAVVDKTLRRVVADGHAATRGYRATPGPGYYKRYFSLSGRINWCIEFNSEYWARYGQSMLWLTTTITPEAEADYAALEAKLASSTYQLRDQLLIPLLTTHGRSEDEVAAYMAKQAASVAKLLAAVDQ